MIKIIAWGAVFYILYCGFLYFFQRWIIFPRGQAVSMPWTADKVAGLEKIDLELEFGKVESWFLPPATGQGRRPVVLFAHGNAELIDHWPEALHPLTLRGVGVFLVEYPGYGRSDGYPSQETITEAFVKACDRIVERPDVDPEKLVFMGRSLGGGAVCALAEKRRPAALILLSTFTSVRNMAKSFGAPGFFVRDPFDNLKTVRSYDGPVLTIHGKYDDVIPYSHGKALSQAASSGTMKTYECAHNDFPPSWDLFYDDVTKFLESAGILDN